MKSNIFIIAISVVILFACNRTEKIEPDNCKTISEYSDTVLVDSMKVSLIATKGGLIELLIPSDSVVDILLVQYKSENYCWQTNKYKEMDSPDGILTLLIEGIPGWVSEESNEAFVEFKKDSTTYIVRDKEVM